MSSPTPTPPSLQNKHLEIVISRYRESLNWLQEYPFNDPALKPFVYYTIYNKGGDDNNFIKPAEGFQYQVIPLPNVGRCDHTYLYHIVNGYTTSGASELANITLFLPGSLSIEKENLFLPGSLYIEKKNKRAKEIIEEMRKLAFRRAVFIAQYSDTGIANEFKNFHLNFWKCTSPDNRANNNESALVKCRIRPFGKWFQYFFGDIPTPIHYLCYWGIFAIDKRDILQHPVSHYQVFLHNLSQSSNPELGHYIERSWCALFYPMRFTKILQIRE